MSIDEKFEDAVCQAKIRIYGENDVVNDSHKQVAIAVTEAYGQSLDGFIYFEPCTSQKTERPPDVLICHPEVGLINIEVKGYCIESIVGTEAGNIKFYRRNFLAHENPYRQAERAMFSIRDAVSIEVGDQYNLPLFNYIVAFPRISTSQWCDRGYDKTLPPSYTLLRDDIEDRQRLRSRLQALVNESLAKSKKRQPITAKQLESVRKVFGDSSVINKPPKSVPVKDMSIGAMLYDIDSRTKYLTDEQKELSQLAVDGRPRLIRGVAGSGKTVVLASIVANIAKRNTNRQASLLKEEKCRIAVVCFNRSLVPFQKENIFELFEMKCPSESYQDITISHLNGLMFELSKKYPFINYIKVDDYPDEQERARLYLQQISQAIAGNFIDDKVRLFDVLFVDEGQDFFPEEYELLLSLVRPTNEQNDKNIFIFYDDAQNVYGRPRPTWSDLGIRVVGARSSIMRTCHRNHKKIVEFGFNILLGTRSSSSEKVLTRTFAGVAELAAMNLVSEFKDYVKVNFAEDKGLPLPYVLSFDSRKDEIDWVSKRILSYLTVEEVASNNILIVCNTPSEFNELKYRFSKEQTGGVVEECICPYGNSQDKDKFIFRSGCLTLSTVQGAKGYDSHIVFIVGADLFDQSIEGRAKFYVAATRAKTILHVTGVGNTGLMSEALSLNEVMKSMYGM